MLERFYLNRSVIVMCKALTENDGPPNPALTIKMVEEEDLDKLHALNCRRCLSRATPSVSARLGQGQSGVIAYAGSDAVAYVMCADHSHAAAALEQSGYTGLLSVQPAEAYFDELYVATDRRRERIGESILASMEAMLFEAGFRRLWLCVDVENTPARRLYDALGYSAVRSVTWRRRLRKWSAIMTEWADPPGAPSAADAVEPA